VYWNLFDQVVDFLSRLTPAELREAAEEQRRGSMPAQVDIIKATGLFSAHQVMMRVAAYKAAIKRALVGDDPDRRAEMLRMCEHCPSRLVCGCRLDLLDQRELWGEPTAEELRARAGCDARRS